MGSETFILVQGTKTQCCLYSFYPISYYHPWGWSWLDHGEVIYLGVTIDSHLTWVPHINSICKKVAPKIGALSRLRYILPYESLYTVYSSIILPSLNYCCTVWGHCSNSKLSKLQGYQNRAARIICNNFDWDVHGLDLVQSLGWQTLRDQIN